MNDQEIAEFKHEPQGVACNIPEPGPPPLVLTDEQQRAVTDITAWMEVEDKPEFRLGGYAGTGKTTVIKTIKEQLRKNYGVVVASFTGKAVDVLQRKGITAQTLHSLIYHAIPVGKGRVIFEKRSKLESNPDVVVIDEASMVSTELYDDLRGFGTKLLFVGDPGQLEPVGDNPQLMREPDLVLQTIHRQAALSPIIRLANSVRNGGRIDYSTGDELTVRRKGQFDFGAVSQIICARNKTRVIINETARGITGRSGSPLVEGEKIIVLRNSLPFGVFNGMILFVDSIEDATPDYWEINATDEIGRKYEELPLWKEPYTNPLITTKKEVEIPRIQLNGEERKTAIVYSTYAYAITCHKSQGSEWEHVLVVDEWMPPEVWDMKRWRYTAITRAAKKLTYCL